MHLRISLNGEAHHCPVPSGRRQVYVRRVVCEDARRTTRSFAPSTPRCGSDRYRHSDLVGRLPILCKTHSASHRDNAILNAKLSALPAAARSLLRRVVLDSPKLPAPELLDGVSRAWVLNNTGSPSYLLGKFKVGGWWYFYLCAVALKVPLPLLIAFALGTFPPSNEKREGDGETSLFACLRMLALSCQWPRPTLMP